MNDFEARWAPTLRMPNLRDMFTHRADDRPEDAQTVEHTGIMVAFFPSTAQAQSLAIDGGEIPSELHLTLAYLGDIDQDVPAEAKESVLSAVQAWAGALEPIPAKLNGLGLFKTPNPVTYANVDSPALPAARQKLVEHLAANGTPANAEHGYTPHVTLAYDDRRDIEPPVMDLLFTEVVVAWGGEHTVIALGSQEKAGAAGAQLQVQDRPQAPEQPQDLVSVARTFEPVNESIKAFVTDINGRTLVTGPATIAAYREPTVDDITNQHMLWMHGRFVGAEVPNRNGALWSSGDLQMAKGSVVNGPLNWLHDARHVIGTLAKADYVEAGEHAAAGSIQPHITATAAIWRWIYPDEAYVVQQASDAGMLWYSMECISKEVSCVGDSGCGNTTSYRDYMAGAACTHVTQRASVRQFINPVFLGGAVIVPPTRPGWAEADASVMTSANALAEAAFDQAGRPNIPASDWEKLMAQLVRFAN